MGFTCSLLKKT